MRRASRFHGALAFSTAVLGLAACGDGPPELRGENVPSGASPRYASSAVAPAPNVAPRISVGSTATVYSGATFDLTASFSDPGTLDAPWTTSIVWGDGTATTGRTTRQSVPITASHRYLRTGAYTVRLTVTDRHGGAAESAIALHVARFPTLIDVGAKDPTNTIPLRSGDPTLDVALLSTPSFDARSVTPTSVLLTNGTGSGTRLAHARRDRDYRLVDVNRDGLIDMLLVFRKSDMIANNDLTAATTKLILFADGSDGRETRGEDLVSVKP